ncbi:MAG TPA: SemiSWEET transporter [Chitinophaga sp.]|uniref:SemiSWEET family sugar transporter n=1 Tax=Chitinophaga sp. TaxID=1869181 RepID=UPI002DB643DA|nr:SemiSWEET transporter [Chitinophaga sp.]HEU4555544.1 SemiSWEET transporter [Chitinophaga sp.]
MQFIEILGLVAGICTSSSLIPQLVKTIKRKKADDVSVVMFIVMMTGNSLWIYYGTDKSDLPIIATNILALSLNIAMLILKFKFRR